MFFKPMLKLAFIVSISAIKLRLSNLSCDLPALTTVPGELVRLEKSTWNMLLAKLYRD